ncbi:MAG: cell division topological specificity factor MinE [Clostridia bacterium]|nr:cell division topological specificity factor MinE [Clostridia bacterium]
MFENISEFFKRFQKSDKKELLAENPTSQSKETAKDRLHVVLMQDRANVSADFLELMKEEIIEVIKKYIVVDESKIDVRLTNEENEDGTLGAPLLHANIPILNVRNDLKGSYMNNNSSEKIEGQQEINMEETVEEKSVSEEKKEEPKVVAVPEPEPEPAIVVEAEVAVMPEQETVPVPEAVSEPEVVEVAQIEQTEEVVQEEPVEEVSIEIETEAPEAIVDELTDEELDDDDDVTFDDLLKAAEEEEEKLKQLEENKEEKKPAKKKTTTQKKKKTSKNTKK